MQSPGELNQVLREELEMAATTGRPARTRAARTTPTKAAPKAVATKAEVAEVEPEVTEAEVYVMDLEYVEDTKTYAKFVPPTGSGCVGQFYAPLGTKAVKVKITG
jgi:hypothetical protein